MKTISFEGYYALKNLVEKIRDLKVFVYEEGNTESLVTTAKYLDHDTFDLEDWKTCLREMNLDDVIVDASMELEYIRSIRRHIDLSVYRFKTPVEVYHRGDPVKVYGLDRDEEYEDVFCLISDDPEVYDCFMLSDISVDDARKIYEDLVTEQIDDGFDWKSYAMDLLESNFSGTFPAELDYFLTYEWQNLKTDEENLRIFRETR